MKFRLFTPDVFESKFLWIKKKVITRWDNEPYLIRYTLLTTPWFSVKIHKILASDDACLHDHPWAFLSIVLKNGYVEHSFHVPDGINEDTVMFCRKNKGQYIQHQQRKQIKAPAILFRRANWAHRLEIDKSATTLVVTFKKTRQWGFFTPNGWIKWFNYKQDNQCE